MMNYREEALTDEHVIARQTTGVHHANELCTALTSLVLQAPDRAANGGGLFSRIKSTIFSSYESAIHCSFVASCRLSAEPESLFLGVKSDGVCSLLRVDFSSSPPAAVELSSVSLAHSREGYSVASLRLSHNQGWLAAVSCGSGRIAMLTIKGERVGIKKNMTLPVSAPISGLFLHSRSDLVELFVILDKSHIAVIPDTSKSTDYYFIFTTGLQNRIKLSEFYSICDESFSLAWDHRNQSSSTERNPTKSSLLLTTKLNNLATLQEFKSVFLFEKCVELLTLRHPGSAVPPLVRTESLRRLDLAVTLPNPSYESVIKREVSELEKAMDLPKCSFEISAISCDEISGKLLILFANGRVSEIVPTSNALERYINTFLSAPFVFKFINERLSRESVLNLFGASREWVSLFTCASVAESIGSSLIDAVALIADPHAAWQQVAQKKLTESITGDVKSHIESCLAVIGNVSLEKRIDLVASQISAAVNHPIDTTSQKRIQESVANLTRLLKYYLVYAAYSAVTVRPDLLRLLKQLMLLNLVLSRVPQSVNLATRLADMEISTIGDFCEKMEIFFLPGQIFSIEIGFLSSCSDLVAHAGLRRFWVARSLALSPSAGERQTALSMFKECETEISLFSKFFSATSGEKNEYMYWSAVLEPFVGDYERELVVLDRLAVLASPAERTRVQKKSIERAIASADWTRTKSLLAQLPPAARPEAIRLISTEARIRNQLNQVFDLLRDNKEAIAQMVTDVELEVASTRSTRETEKCYMQILSLSSSVGDYACAADAMMKLYAALVCGASRPQVSTCPPQDLVFIDYVDLKQRLHAQLRALLLAKSVPHPHTTAVTHVTQKIVFVESMLAFLSFTSDAESMESLLTEGGVSVQILAKNLAAMGLLMLASSLARLFGVDVFQCVVAPYVELLVRCEADPQFLPPCRWEESESTTLVPEVLPSMSFVRSDAGGPIGTAGSQIKAMHRALEHVLRTSKSKQTTLNTIEHLFLVKNRENIPNFLIDIIESQDGWTDLLKVYMRKECFAESVRLVETHVKFWRPDPAAPVFASEMVMNVPLLVQLQRALQLAGMEDEELAQLGVKLDAALEVLKQTLKHVAQRLM